MHKSYERMTLSAPYRRIRQTNSTDANYTTRDSRLAWTGGADNTPSGVGDAAAQTTMAVFDISGSRFLGRRFDSDAKPGATRGRFIFWGTAAQNLTFKVRILLWDFLMDRDKDPAIESLQIVPTTGYELLCTTGARQGNAGGVADASQFFVDTIALQGTAGNDDVNMSIVSPADDTYARVSVDFEGAQRFSVEFDRNGSAASCNGAWKPY